MDEIIKDRAPKPSGLLPKNLQAFILVGLSLAMVLIMAVTGHKRPVKASEDRLAAAPVSPVNTGKVLDFQKGIEQNQRDSAPQAEAALLEQQRLLAAAGKWQQPAPSSPFAIDSASRQYPAAGAGGQSGAPQAAPDPIREEERKRQYLSFFADNVALSFRRDGGGGSSRQAPAGGPGLQPNSLPGSSPEDGPASQSNSGPAQIGPQLAREEQLLQQMQELALANQSPNARNSGPPKPVGGETVPPASAASKNNGSGRTPHSTLSVPLASGKTFVIFEGTILEALLVNRLDGTFAGPVSCLLSDDIYSHDRQHVLIPAGSKILGEARKVDTLGQTRLAIVFHRLLMPDGYSVNLDQFQGIDQQGATALKDKVNHHYLTIFGASLALGVLGGVAQIGTGSALTSSGPERLQEGFGTGMANAGEDVLNRFLNILPTVTIREGARVKIYLSADLLLPDYASHTMSADI
jgi:type IV secretion system protein TrbI